MPAVVNARAVCGRLNAASYRSTRRGAKRVRDQEDAAARGTRRARAAMKESNLLIRRLATSNPRCWRALGQTHRFGALAPHLEHSS